MLPHPFLVSEYVKIYKMKDEVAAVKELAKIQVFYCFYYAAAVCNRVEDEFYWGSEDVDEDWHAIIREAFFRYMAHRLHKIPAHMNREDYDRLKETAMSAKNSGERKFLGLSFNHKKEMIFDKDCMFDLFCNFILGGFMCKKPLQNYIFLFMNLLGTYNLYPFFKLLIYPASTSWIVTKGILKDVEIQEMTIPAIIVDCAYLNQCFTCRSTARFHYKYFTRVCKAHTTTDFALFLKEEFLYPMYCRHSFAKRIEAVFLQNKESWQDAFLQKVLADMKEGQGDFAVLDLSTVGEQFSKFLSNNLVCDCDHEEDEARISDLD